MKIVDLLRKLGILRYGVKSGTYTSSKDMPPELFMEDVYDAKSDLIHQEDVKAATEALRKGGARKILYWISLVAGVLFLCLFLLGAGISPWFFLTLILWAGYLTLTVRFAYGGRYSYLAMGGLAVATLFLSVIILGAAAPI